MTIKDKQITTLQPKLTGDGELLIRDGDGVSSIDPISLLALSGPNNNIVSEDTSAKIEAKDGAVNEVTGALELNSTGTNASLTSDINGNLLVNGQKVEAGNDNSIENPTNTASVTVNNDDTINIVSPTVDFSGTVAADSFTFNNGANPEVTISSDPSGYGTLNSATYGAPTRIMVEGGSINLIESPDTSISLVATNAGIAAVGDITVNGSLTTEDELQINNSSMVFNNTNESIIISNVPQDATVNNGSRSYSTIIGKNNCTNLNPDDTTGLGQSVTSIGCNALAAAVNINRSEAIGAATCNFLVDGQYVSVRGYHSLQKVTTCTRTSVSGPFNLTNSTSISNSSVHGVSNAENANGGSIIINGINNFANATNMTQSGGFGLNLGSTLDDGTNVWLIGSGIDVPTANTINYMNLGNTAIMDLQNRRLAVGELDTTDKAHAKVHIANGKAVTGDLNGLTSGPLLILGDQNEVATINVSGKSSSNSVNGHIIMSSRWNNTVRDAVAVKGSVSIGLANEANAEFRVVRSDNANYSTLASVNSGSGDLELHNLSAGVTLKSPDGTRWKLTVDNTGALISTQL